MSEEEYEVESIVQARLEQKRGKKKNLCWRYKVRWKGYKPEDDTWEPAESFVDSEHIIERFWERANAGGRDYRDMSLFSVGEDFVPTGPPRRGIKRKPSAGDISATQSIVNPKPSQALEPVPSTSNNKPTSNIARVENPDNERPHKRVREISRLSEISPTKKPRPLSPVQTTSQIAPQLSTSTKLSKKKARAPSIDEVIPASDEELVEYTGDIRSTVENAMMVDLGSPTTGHETHDSTPPGYAATHTKQVPKHLQSADISDPLVNLAGRNQKADVPFHRVKAANPRVKMVDEQSLAELEKGEPVKARLRGSISAHVTTPQTVPIDSLGGTRSTSRARPGPGRSSSGLLKNNVSSLLTFEKGELKTVKGRYVKGKKERSNDTREDQYEGDSSPHGSLWGDDNAPGEDVSCLVQVPPTAEELLQLAGTTKDNDVLSDFEDDAPVTVNKTPNMESNSPGESRTALATELQPEEALTASQQSGLELAKDKLFPSGASTAALGTLNSTWKQSTIFGPLGYGSHAQNNSESTTSQSTRSSPFILSLDTSATIPVILADSPSGSSTFDFLVGNTGPPGKFYSSDSALALLDTVRTGGSSASIVPDATSTPDQRSQFEHFRSRLNSGEMFVAMAGVEVLAFCSSDNALLSQRLNIPPLLLSQPACVLLSRVTIENYSAYAEAALDADGRRWQWTADSALA